MKLRVQPFGKNSQLGDSNLESKLHTCVIYRDVLNPEDNLVVRAWTFSLCWSNRHNIELRLVGWVYVQESIHLHGKEFGWTRAYSKHEIKWDTAQSWIWVWEDGRRPYISTPRNEWLLAILSVLRVAERMKQVEQSCIGAGKVSPEPEAEQRR